jgi:chorismate synthase
MNGNHWGKIFRISTYGESHGPAIGAVIDGCPSGIPLSPQDFLEDMARRQGGNSTFSTPRREEDAVEIESGVFEGLTTGTPISLRIRNQSQRSADYEEFRRQPRPGHADLTTYLKHGHRDHRGGGRSSARETAARVAAGVVAKKVLRTRGVEILAWVERVGARSIPPEEQDAALVRPLSEIKGNRDASPLSLPFAGGDTNELLGLVESLRLAQDSLGGSLRCRVDGLPTGLGEPVFDKLNALLAHAAMSLPAAVYCEVGGGYVASLLPGSAIRDPIETGGGGPRPAANRHGGLLGGMTTGWPLHLAVGFHAPTSIPRAIATVNQETGHTVEIRVGGRHDAFPLPRAVPMLEAMVAITLTDAMLRAGRLPEEL